MSRDTVANPPSPYVAFGDIFTSPPLPPKVSRIIRMAPKENNKKENINALSIFFFLN